MAGDEHGGRREPTRGHATETAFQKARGLPASSRKSRNGRSLGAGVGLKGSFTCGGLAARHGVTVLNAPGTVDADYRGEVGVLLINHGDAPFTIRRGERIAQMVIAPVTRAELVAVPSLSSTDRGSGGFGSTGR